MSRDTTNSSTTPKPTGLAFLDEYSGHIDTLYDASVLRLSSVSGVNTITASVTPTLPSGGLVAGMKFTAVWASNNTGAATLNIGATGAKSIVSKTGGTLVSGQLAAGSTDLLEYDGSQFVLVTDGAGSGVAAASGRTVYDVTGVWDNNYPANIVVMVECWGAGSGGASASSGPGGGGGAYQRAYFRAGDLPASVTITVPSGGAVNAAGGNCTFGSHVTAYGGYAAPNSTSGQGGLGAPVVKGSGDAPDTGSGLFGGGQGGAGAAGTAPFSGSPGCWGGGGGGGGAFYGGGASLFGGSGGDAGIAGSRPGGGGGGNAIGGAGRCIVTIF